MKLPINEIICGDCVEVLADFPQKLDSFLNVIKQKDESK